MQRVLFILLLLYADKIYLWTVIHTFPATLTSSFWRICIYYCLPTMKIFHTREWKLCRSYYSPRRGFTNIEQASLTILTFSSTLGFRGNDQGIINQRQFSLYCSISETAALLVYWGCYNNHSTCSCFVSSPSSTYPVIMAITWETTLWPRVDI